MVMMGIWKNELRDWMEVLHIITRPASVPLFFRQIRAIYFVAPVLVLRSGFAWER
jgi:hypothetical protein